MGALLATAVSVQSGGAWWGDFRRDLRYEARGGIYALKDDGREFRARAESVPNHVRAFWSDMSNEIRILKADVSSDARVAAKRLATLIKTS